jgi:hypothetical protein
VLRSTGKVTQRIRGVNRRPASIAAGYSRTVIGRLAQVGASTG